MRSDGTDWTFVFNIDFKTIEQNLKVKILCECISHICEAGILILTDLLTPKGS